MTINVRVEYEPTPIRHIAVQCPHCQRWFKGYDITNNDLNYDYQLNFATFNCPICKKSFGYNSDRLFKFHNTMSEYQDKIKIEESSFPEVYDGCLEKKEQITWE